MVIFLRNWFNKILGGPNKDSNRPVVLLDIFLEPKTNVLDHPITWENLKYKNAQNTRWGVRKYTQTSFEFRSWSWVNHSWLFWENNLWLSPNSSFCVISTISALCILPEVLRTNMNQIGWVVWALGLGVSFVHCTQIHSISKVISNTFFTL